MRRATGRVFHRCACKSAAATCGQLGDGLHGSWYFSVELLADDRHQRRRFRTGGYSSETEARTALALVLGAPAGRPAAGWNVGTWLTHWLSSRAGLRRETTRNYESHLRLYLIPVLGSIPLAALTPADIRLMLSGILLQPARNGCGPRTTSVVRVHATLRTASNAAMREGLIATNPTRLVELPQRRKPHPVVWTGARVKAWRASGERPPVAVWTAAQTAQFLTFIADDPLFPLLHVIALRGLRRGEAIGLRWSEVNLDDATLTVCRQLQETDGALRVSPPKSAASNRELPLDAGTVALLRDHQAAQLGADAGAYGWVFPKPDGTPYSPSWVTHRFRTLVRESGLPPVRLHDLRHGAATLALAAGADLKTIQDMLGHASIVLTADTYTSVLPEVARQAATGIAQLILDAGRKSPGRSHRKPNPNGD